MENSKMRLFALAALALLAASGMISALSSYGQPCASDADCWSQLKCDVMAGKCTQPAVVCTNMPEAWTPQLSVPGGSNNSSNMTTYISMLENGTWMLTNETSGTGVYQAGWFSNWQLLSLIGVAAAIAIIAIAAMVGHAFNLPEVKAFVDAELMQAVVSVLLVASLIGLVAFLDETTRIAVGSGSLPVLCNANEPCYISAAKQYLDNIYDAANAAAKDSLKKSFDNQGLATTGYSVQFNVWYLAFAGTSWRYNAGWSMEAERGSAVFETLGTLLAGIYAQKYFLDVILFGIAPVFLLLGVLLRTFFFTRKLGGLLLAIAIALFIVYPLTFAFAWYTLNVTVYGDRVLPSSDSSCPAECTATYPVAFYVNSSGGLVQFRTTQEMLEAGISDSNWASGGPGGKYPGLVACRDLSSAFCPSGDPSCVGSLPPNSCDQCPDYCREVPFPSNLPGCNVAQCAPCNAGCKIMRQRVDPGNNQYGCTKSDCDPVTCPKECKLQIPVENKCYNPEGTTGGSPVAANLAATCGGCSGCPSWCMVLYDNGAGRELMNKNEKPCQVPACLPSSQGGSCPDSCMYISSLPSASTNCDDICKDSDGNVCPKYCRVTGTPNALADYDTSGLLAAECTGKYAEACANCKGICETDLTAADNSDYTANCAPFPKKSDSPTNCAACPDYCRFQNYTNYSIYGSNTQLMEGNATTGSEVAPEACSKLALPGFDCEIADCSNSCWSQTYPVLCREYDASSSLSDYCTLCGENLRVNLSYSNSSGGLAYSGLPNYSNSMKCGSPACPVICKQLITVPTSTLSAAHIVQQDCQVGGINTTVTGQTPANCSECIIGNSPAGLCACDPQGSAVEKQPVPDTKANASACGYDMPHNSTPVLLPTDAKGCVGNKSLDPLWCGGCPIGTSRCCSNNTKNWLCNVTDECMTYPPTNGPGCMNSTGQINSVSACNNQAHFNYTTANLTYTVVGCSACTSTFSPGTPCDSETAGCCGPNGACVDGMCKAIGTGTCADYNSSYSWRIAPRLCEMCRPDCRLSDLSGLNDTCTSATLAGAGNFNPCDDSHCPAACKATIPPATICSEYLGAGPGLDAALYPIDGRSSPYDNRSGCKQCPENCRITYSDGTYYTGSCGVPNNNAGAVNIFVDCSIGSCPAACRTVVPAQSGSCGPSLLSDMPGTGCPAMCRRSSEVASQIPSATEAGDGRSGYCPSLYCGPFNAIAHFGLTDQCLLPDPPSVACEGCASCPSDCLYTPPVRTDCSDVCSDQALAGPVDIGPTDFIQDLPGAVGESDVKNAGTLMIPALVLPLFGLVIVVAFIRVLSPILGGDMEIPGLGRII